MSNIQRHHEHGQDWLTCLDCGASWSIVIESNDHDEWEAVEEIDFGDESCDEHDTEAHLKHVDNECEGCDCFPCECLDDDADCDP